jgi:hypothetical protein
VTRRTAPRTGRPSTVIAIASRLPLALAFGALLLSACATGNVSTSASTSMSFGDTRAPSTMKRCSASDPDRNAWFCIIGQFLYGVAGAMQPDGGYSLR